MARYKLIDESPKFLPVDLSQQLPPAPSSTRSINWFIMSWISALWTIDSAPTPLAHRLTNVAAQIRLVLLHQKGMRA